MSDSPHLTLPYLAGAQAQKHLTVNESLSLLDGLIHLSVISRATATLPATPLDGDRYLIAASPTAEWTGHAGQLALRMEGAWRFLAPREGWRMWVADENAFLVFDGATWVASGSGGGASWGTITGTLSTQTDLQTALNAKAPASHTHPSSQITDFQNLPMLGVNATADTTNKFSVNSGAALFNHAGAGTQIKINKNAVADTASFLFQTGFSGRAEIGTTGDNNLHVKVSADGSSYFESLLINGTNGLATMRSGFAIEPAAAEPTTPVNGQVWYNSTTGKFRARQNGASVDVITAGSTAAWGSITGALSAQTDLQSALNAKLDVAQASIFGLSLLDDPDAATARATLGLGSAATLASTTFANSSHGHTLANVTDVTMTAANLNTLDDGVNTTLHFHDSDRARANHTGTQTAATISDFAVSADARIAAASINALADVIVTAPSTGQVIKFNGTNWVNDTDATAAGGGGQSAILFQEEGTALGASGTVDTINFRGSGVIASRTGNTLTVDAKRYIRETLARPTPGVASLTAIGCAVTGTGTATSATPAATSVAAQQVKLEYLVTTAAATAIAGFRLGTLTVWRGNGVGLGGFRLRCRWGNATGAATATSRAFCGLSNSTAAPTDVEPSSLASIIGMGWDAADANIQLMSNDATGIATKIDLGTAFPVPVTDRAAVYDLELSCAANDTKIDYVITNVVTGAVAAGSATVDLPAATAFLAPRGWISVGGTSSVVGFALMSLTLESDY